MTRLQGIETYITIVAVEMDVPTWEDMTRLQGIETFEVRLCLQNHNHGGKT